MRTRDAIEPLVHVVDRLLAPDGCPWDREQTLESLRPYLLEEAFEAVSAIDGGSPAAIREELGDVLFLLVFLARVAELRHDIALGDLASASAEKMIRRHPWVFGDAPRGDVSTAMADWEAQKAKEKKEHGRLAGVPVALPALLRALRVGEKASTVGYDFADAPSARQAVHAELAELDAAMAGGDASAVEHEIGDVLFSTANLARKLGLDPESALRGALDRFSARFRAVEIMAADRGLDLASASDAARDALWDEAKARTGGG